MERVQPWLGTLVTVRASGLAEGVLRNATEVAFAEVATVHRAMSFHDMASDVGRLNRQPAGEPMAVHPYTFEVLEQALAIAEASSGCFDVTVARDLVADGLLPHPQGRTPEPGACWRDLELRADQTVTLHRPLWMDLGGIAKGFAVDRAATVLAEHGVTQGLVNAGGDLRVFGPAGEPVALDVDELGEGWVPTVNLWDGSLASSSGHVHRRRFEAGMGGLDMNGGRRGPHIDGLCRTAARMDRFVCVTARECVIADGLTKVVMAQGRASAGILRRFGASAHYLDTGAEWEHMDSGAGV